MEEDNISSWISATQEPGKEALSVDCGYELLLVWDTKIRRRSGELFVREERHFGLYQNYEDLDGNEECGNGEQGLEEIFHGNRRLSVSVGKGSKGDEMLIKIEFFPAGLQ